MTEPRSDEAVHQAFFGWSHDHQKLDLISFSFQRQPEGPSWQAKLEEHARLQPSSTEKPVSSLSYIDLQDGYVAVLRRVAQGHTAGRNNSHALIGPAAVIDVRVALGLGAWDGWRETTPDERYMQAYHVNHIAGVVGHAERLRTHIEQHERGLGMVLAQLLDNPDLPLSIIGCPNQLRLPMVWGLYAAAATWLHESGHPRWWTFSTYEVSHDDSIRCLPEIVFLPARPLGAGSVNRTIVDLDTEAQASANSTLLASQMLATVFRGTPSPVPKPVRESVPAGAGAAVHGASHPAHPNHFEQRPAGHEVAQQPPAERRRTAALLGANSLRDFEVGLTELETSTHFPHDRQVLRGELDIAAMDTASRFVENTVRRELFDRLLRITYGPNLEDLSNNSNALEHATKAISQSQSELLVMMLGRAAAQKRNGPVRDAALDRSATGVRLPAHAATDRATRRGRAKNRLLPYVPAAILLLALVFLLGYLVGRPDATPQTVAPPAGGNPAGSAAQTPAKPTPPPNPREVITTFAVSTANSPVREGEKVFGFVKQGSNLYPQAPCTVAQDNVTWTCAQHWQPPPAQGRNRSEPDVELVAYKVPTEEQGSLNQAAMENKPVPKGQLWLSLSRG